MDTNFKVYLRWKYNTLLLKICLKYRYQMMQLIVVFQFKMKYDIIIKSLFLIIKNVYT